VRAVVPGQIAINRVHANTRTDIAYITSLALGLAALLMVGALSWRIGRLGIDDFSTIWAGPRALLTGADPYDALTWSETAVRVGTHVPDTAVYLYPPWVALALAPFALLPPAVAGALWTMVGLAAAIIAVRSLLRASVPGAAWVHGIAGFMLLASTPAIVTLLAGQWTFLLLALVATMVMLLRADRPVAAGVVAVALLAKPPLFVFAAAALAIRALWRGEKRAAGVRFVMTASVAGLSTIGVSWALIPTWWPAWLFHVASVQVGVEPVTLSTLLVTLAGPLGAWIAALAVVVGVCAALQFHPRGDAWLPVWFALSSAATVYSNTYDALLLVLPLVLAAGALMPRSPRRALVVVVVGAALMLVVMPPLHALEVRKYAEVLPLAVSLLVTVALWPQRRDGPLDERARRSGSWEKTARVRPIAILNEV
jgi:hypothetical protein